MNVISNIFVLLQMLLITVRHQNNNNQFCSLYRPSRRPKILHLQNRTHSFIVSGGRKLSIKQKASEETAWASALKLASKENSDEEIDKMDFSDM